jgi:hypothetical protein
LERLRKDFTKRIVFTSQISWPTGPLLPRPERQQPAIREKERTRMANSFRVLAELVF